MTSTPRQADCLKVIETSIAWRGYSPSYREMGKALGVAKSGIHRLVAGLEARGAITRLPNRPHGLEITRDGSDALAYFAPDVRGRVQRFAQAQGIPAQAAVAEICRRYFRRTQS
jgi:repressor LexA